MENASKAIIIAGGLLLTMVIVTMIVFLFNSIGNVYREEGETLTEKQLEEYNRKFAMYNDTKGLYGSELLSLANLIMDYDNRLLYGEEDINPGFYEENKVVVYVTFYTEISGVRDEEGKKWIYDKLKPKVNRTIEEFKAYYDGIGENMKHVAGTEYEDLKSLQTEIKSMPYVCNKDKTKYNKYGRISEMYFEQVLDNDVGTSIHKPKN